VFPYTAHQWRFIFVHITLPRCI